MTIFFLFSDTRSVKRRANYRSLKKYLENICLKGVVKFTELLINFQFILGLRILVLF